MKILHIETGRHLYGGALQVCYLMEGLANRGIENLLVCSINSKISKTAAAYATVLQVPMLGDLDFIFPFRLGRIIRKERPDIVHVHSRRGADTWSGICASFYRTPSVLTRRVDNREWSPFARLKYKSYDKIITISEGIRQVLLSEGLDDKQVQCIHSVVNTEDYQLKADKEWFAKEFDIQSDAQVIGVIAQLITRKGHRFLLEIIPRLLELFPKLKIVFCGQGPLEAELKARVASLGLDKTVIFAGFRNDMPQILPCLDLVVHPALMEGLGVSLLQAAAAGIPIVGANAGGIPEIVHNRKNGLLVEPGNTEQMFEAIKILLEDKALTRQYGNAGKELVRQLFSVDKMVDSYIRLYSQILEDKG